MKTKLLMLIFVIFATSCSVDSDSLISETPVGANWEPAAAVEAGFADLYELGDFGQLSVSNTEHEIWVEITTANASIEKLSYQFTNSVQDFPTSGNKNLQPAQLENKISFGKGVDVYSFSYPLTEDIESINLAVNITFKRANTKTSVWVGDILGNENHSWKYLEYYIQNSTPSVCNVNAGSDKTINMSYQDAAAIESWDEVRKLYLSLLDEGVDRAGSFDPSIWDLINDFNTRGAGSYTTKYTLAEGECSDSALLTVNVISDVSMDQPCEGFSAGADKKISITQAEAAALPSWDEVRKLYLSLLDEEVSRTGEFDPSIWDLINAFNQNPIGDFTTTYTVSNGECSDSVMLTITVLPLVSDPSCSLNAGPDNSITLTYSQAEALPSWDEVRKLYLNMLPAGVSRTGSFDPSIWDLINKFSEKGVGAYTTTYTIVEGNCSDSTELTINVVAD